MVRRLVVLLILGAALVATPALADYGQQKQQLDAKLAAVQQRLSAARQREQQLNGQIGGLTKQIDTLESKVGNVAAKMSALQADLALRHRRLNVLNALLRVQTGRLQDLRQAYRIALTRLEDRLVALYESPEPGPLDLVVQAKSFQDVLDQINYLGLVAKQDRSIAQQVHDSRDRVTAARVRTRQARQRVADQANLINARLQQVAIIHAELLTSQHALSKAKSSKSLALLAAQAQEQAAIKEAHAIQAASAALAARIRAAETNSDNGSPPPTPSAAGFIWPVNGPITSPFGPRWGGFHPGIDIGVPEGTPIHAAAAGTVIYCSWEDGYGNLVVIDHHNGLATAYAHQSKIEASCGQDVSQGQEIGLVGCTGFCTGPHLHFEVRVNGTPVDPLGYLP
jgi:murein DD-endopeptidase MepM/ murein hydrolase activator NlpD